jgi:hypothetical protein
MEKISSPGIFNLLFFLNIKINQRKTVNLVNFRLNVHLNGQME